MNFVVLFPEEWNRGSEVTLSVERSRYLRATHNLKKGDPHAAVLLERSRGQVILLDDASEQVTLQILTGEPIAAQPLTAIVAVPRPQILKKVLSQAAMLGIAVLHLVRAEKTEKSYLTSHVLDRQSLQRELLLGIEQGGSCELPHVELHDRFVPFIERLSAEKSHRTLSVVGSLRAASILAPRPLSAQESAAFAIGPEAGWNEFEEQQFEKCGFNLVSLGARILRVDTAFVYIASKFILSV